MNKIIVVNKEKDYTSRDVVNVLNGVFGTKKIGHTGTLDPIATGVLVILVGEYTKICELITSYDKEYIAKIMIGTNTDTLDITGNILEEKNIDNISDDDIKRVLESFIGSYNQEVPIYSAVKIKGKKLYEYARDKKEIDLPSREVHIHTLELISDIERSNGKIIFTIKTNVSKGTYIRSLIRDIGNRLNNVAVMLELTRTKQGNFCIEDASTLDDIKNGNYKEIKIKDALLFIEHIMVSDDILLKIRNGSILDKFFNTDMALILDKNNKETAIYKTYEKDNSKVKPYKMFND